jgi:hypothetical protein
MLECKKRFFQGFVHLGAGIAVGTGCASFGACRSLEIPLVLVGEFGVKNNVTHFKLRVVQYVYSIAK